MNARLDAYREGVDRALRDIAAGLTGGDPVSAAMRYALEGSGKRLRPILCLAAMDAVRSAPEATDPAACRAAASLELVHTYSLVHDDLPCMDDDVLRRGRATTHRVFDTRTAMLAGVGLVPLAIRVLADGATDLGVEQAARRQAVRELCAGAGAGGMVGGQVLDLEAEGAELTLTGLRQIHGLKTGALFRASLRIGGVLAGARPGEVAALGRFGERLGLAFQITDDVLDETTEAAALGKTPGKDRAAEKVTFAGSLGVARARQAALAETESAIALLDAAGVRSDVLIGLARFAVDRDR